MKLKGLLAFYIIITISLSSSAQTEWGQWDKWGEQADGTYINPIIPMDFSDIDCIRVGDDYYAISSTMQFSPGMTLLHSRDLVNWEICTNIVTDLTQISPELAWDKMNRAGKGIWAGTIRHHDNKFYLFFGTPDEGYFMTTSETAEGPWEPLTCIMPESGWDDCTVAWDEDGKACFVGTHFADGYKTYLFDMSPDGKHIDLSSARLINEGKRREANKLIKKGGWWYLVFSEHIGGIGRYVMAKRSRNLFGPYSEERQLAVASWDAHEPNQGGIVQGKDGNWYFLTHHGRGDWGGRLVSLLPVSWIDEWPVIGDVLPERLGTMKWEGKMPAPEAHKLHMQHSDNFETEFLQPQWQWNYQPRNEMYSLVERPGWLRLKAFPPIKENTLLKAGNTLSQRSLRSSNNCVTIKIDISNMQDGQRAGLCHFSAQSSAIGLVRTEDKTLMEYRRNDDSSLGIEVRQDIIWLQTRWGMDGIAHYYYSLDGETYVDFGENSPMVWGHYRGDRIGIYNFNDKGEGGWIDIDYYEDSIDSK